MSGVVEELIFGRAPVDVIVFLGAMIEDARVSAGAELPVERELEVAELVPGDEVADGSGLRQHAVDDVPAGGQCLGLVAAPGVGVGTVEERAPSRRGLV